MAAAQRSKPDAGGELLVMERMKLPENVFDVPCEARAKCRKVGGGELAGDARPAGNARECVANDTGVAADKRDGERAAEGDVADGEKLVIVAGAADAHAHRAGDALRAAARTMSAPGRLCRARWFHPM